MLLFYFSGTEVGMEGKLSRSRGQHVMQLGRSSYHNACLPVIYLDRHVVCGGKGSQLIGLDLLGSVDTGSVPVLVLGSRPYLLLTDGVSTLGKELGRKKKCLN